MINGSFAINFRQAGYLSVLIDAIKKLYTTQSEVMDTKSIRDVIGLYLKQGRFGPLGESTAEAQAAAIKDIGNDPNFLSLVKSYEDVIWGGGVPGAGSYTNQEDTDALRAFLPADVRQQQEAPDGITILITYGNLSLSDPKTMNDYVQSTTKSIVGVHLVGDSQIIEVGGQPILEQYEFIARGTDEFRGTSR